MRTYGQYCPIARGAEIFAERWTPLIIRNLHLGCETFGEILEGAPGLSRTLLAQRLKQLERLGIVESAPKAQGRGHRYQLTSSGHDLFKVCETLGEWGARWLEIAPENLDPFVALWSMCNALRRDRLPDQRVVIRLDFTGFRPHERYWLLLEHGEAEICKTYPGLDEDLYITADAEAFVKWHAGQLSWAEATRDSRIQLHGPVMARTGLPDLERPQHVRPHQARRRRCHRELTQRPAAEPLRGWRHQNPRPGTASGTEFGTIGTNVVQIVSGADRSNLVMTEPRARCRRCDAWPSPRADTSPGAAAARGAIPAARRRSRTGRRRRSRRCRRARLSR